MKNSITSTSKYFDAIIRFRNNENIDSKSLAKTMRAIVVLGLPLYIWIVTWSQALEFSAKFIFIYIISLIVLPKVVMMVHIRIKFKSDRNRAIFAITVGGALGLIASLIIYGLTLLLIGCLVIFIFGT